MSYFLTKDERRIEYHDIAVAIDKLHPELRNRHIFEQLYALGLEEIFRQGTTPNSLPYSFSEYL